MRVLYLHTAKAGGTAVKETLKLSGVDLEHSGVRDTHARLLSIERQWDLTKVFVVCNKRDPWERCVSYYYHQHNQTNGFGGFCSALERTGQLKKVFHSWVKDRLHLKKKRSDHHMFSAWEYASVSDFVIDYQNMQEDYDRLCDRLGIAKRTIEVKPHQIGGYTTEYLKHYNEESLNIVADYFIEDIKHLGYNIPRI
tara:strand:- start:1 stop:588 length:588 start_codon:yes stop_codon:yes gene_type:complete